LVTVIENIKPRRPDASTLKNDESFNGIEKSVLLNNGYTKIPEYTDQKSMPISINNRTDNMT
jgi:hypothetical protein